MTFWDATAPIYDIFESFNKAHKQMICKLRQLTPEGASVLELACGTGEISISVSGKASEVLCTDISENMLKIARRKASKWGAENVYFEKTSIFETGKPDASFNVVIASQVLHLLDQPQKACEEIKRITKNAALITIPLLKESTHFGRFLIALYKAVGFSPKHELDVESCKTFLENNGLKDCEYHVIEGVVPLCVAVWRRM